MSKSGKFLLAVVILCVAVVCVTAGCISSSPEVAKNSTDTITIVDDAGRTVNVPADSHRIACVGGCGPTRFLVYLGAEDRIIATDEVETRPSRLVREVRPYALANRWIMNLSVVGDTSGNVNMEPLAEVNPDYLILHYTSPDMALTADRITEITGVPVILVTNQGDFGEHREQFEHTMGILAKVTGTEKRCAEFFRYFDDTFADLQKRTEGLTDAEIPTAYVGGISYNGRHAMYSTDPGYPPFLYVPVKNVAGAYKRQGDALNAVIAKEQILAWNPEYIFVDMMTQHAPEEGAIGELKNDPSYHGMTAVGTDKVYGLVPYVSVGINHESTLVNAYYLGKVLYPERFSDIDPKMKADEIYTFVVGEPVFDKINGYLNNLAFTKLNLEPKEENV